MNYAYRVHINIPNECYSEKDVLDLSEKILDACEETFPSASFTVSGGPEPDEPEFQTTHIQPTVTQA